MVSGRLLASGIAFQARMGDLFNELLLVSAGRSHFWEKSSVLAFSFSFTNSFVEFPSDG